MKACLGYLLSIFIGMLSVAFDASAHYDVGNRVFPATLLIEDPGVADELSLPMISHLKEAGEDGNPATWITETSAEFSKRLTQNLGVSLETAWIDAKGNADGWDNLEASVKYVFYTNPTHEAVLSAGLGWNIGGSGAKRITEESYSTLTPTLFFGKGMGDLPSSLTTLKPVAVTGSVGLAIPLREDSNDPVSSDIFKNQDILEWGMAIQYSIPYLQQHVKDLDIPKPLANAIPVVEFSFETPINGNGAEHTTGTINPGIIFMGQSVQFGLEAQIPLNDETGKGVGYLAQLHFYLDEILPTMFGKPIW